MRNRRGQYGRVVQADIDFIRREHFPMDNFRPRIIGRNHHGRRWRAKNIRNIENLYVELIITHVWEHRATLSLSYATTAVANDAHWRLFEPVGSAQSRQG